MADVDERIVRMDFDDSGLQAGADRAVKTLDRLEKASNLSGAASGLGNVARAINSFDMTSVSDSVEQCSSHFSAFEAFVGGIFLRLGARAADLGVNLVKGMTIKPLTDGFGEYELQMGSIQTILSNTREKLKDAGFSTQSEQVAVINERLDELNEYADQTIYNFSEMTRNIGMFTAAGVGLDESVQSIKGISNLAAISGANSQAASRAMYQMSQAISTGTVKLMDWNSVVNAGMGGEVFQNALKRTARAHGIAVDDIIKKNGSFRDSLQAGWLTSDILTETLGQLTMSYDEVGDASYKAYFQQLKQSGYTDEQAKSILELAKNAQEAATKVRTWTQLWQTVGESLGSGWATTWRTVVGDFEEATELFTWFSDRITGVVNASSDARNEVLKQWAAANNGAGRRSLVDTFKNIFEIVGKPLSAIAKAFGEVFGVTAEQLYNITTAIAAFTKKLVISDEAAEMLYHVFKDVFTILHSVFAVIGNMVRIFISFAKVVWEVVSPLAELGGVVLAIVLDKLAKFSEFVAGASDGAEELASSFGGVLAEGVRSFIGFLGDMLAKGKPVYDFLDGLISRVTTAAAGFVDMVKKSEPAKAIGSGLSSAGTAISDAAAKGPAGMIQTAGSAIKNLGSKIFSALPAPVQNALNAIKAFGTEFFNQAKKFVEGTSLFQNAKKLIANFVADPAKTFLTTVDKLKNGIIDGFGSIKRFLSSFHLDDMFKGIGDTIKGFIDSFSGKLPDFSSITKIFSGGAADAVSGEQESFKANLNFDSKSVTPMMNFFKSLKGAFDYGKTVLSSAPKVEGTPIMTMGTDIATILQNITTGLGSIPGLVKDVFSTIGGAIDGIFEGLDLETVEKWTNVAQGILDLGLTGGLIGFFNSLKKVNTSFADIGKNIATWPAQLGTALEKFGRGFHYVQETKADQVVKIAVALGILAGSLWVVAQIPADDLIRAGIALGIAAAALVGIVTVMAMLTDKLKIFNPASLSGIGSSILGLGLGIAALAAAAAYISEHPISQDAVNTLGGLALFMTMLSGAIGENGKSIKSGGWGMLIMAGALWVLAKVCEDIGKQLGDPKTKAAFEDGFKAISWILGAFAVFFKVAGEGMSKVLSSFLKAGAGLMLAAIAIAIFAGAMMAVDAAFASLKDPAATILLIVGFVAVFGLLAAALAQVKADPVKTAVGLLVFSIAILLMAGAMNAFNGIDLGAMIAGAAAIAVFCLAFGLLASNLDPAKAMGVATASIVFGAAVIVLSLALTILAGLPVAGIITAAGAIAVLLAVFGVMAYALDPSKMMATATAMIVFGAAVLVLAIALSVVAAIPFEKLAPGLLAVMAAFVVFAVVSALLGPASAAMMAAATAFLIFGAAVLLLSLGIWLLVDAIGGLSKMDPDTIISRLGALGSGMGEFLSNLVGDILNNIGKVLSDAIGSVGQGISDAMTNLMNSIGNFDPGVLLKAGGDMLKSIGDGIGGALGELGKHGPDIVKAIGSGITGALGGLGAAGRGLLDAVSKGAGPGIKGMASKGIEIGQNLLKGITSGDLLNNITSTGGKILEGLGSGLSGGLDTISKIGGDIIAGLKKPITDAIDAAGKWASDIANGFINSIKSMFGIASPSKVMSDIGGFIMSGLESGINGMKDTVMNTINGIVNALTGPFKLVADQLGKLGGSGTVNFAKGITAASGGVQKATGLVDSIVNNALGQMPKSSNKQGRNTSSQLGSGIRANQNIAAKQARSMANLVHNGISSLPKQFKSKGAAATLAMKVGLHNNMASAVFVVRNMARAMKSHLNGLYSSFRSSGQNAVRGLISGINSLIGQASAKADQLGRIVAKANRKSLKVKSPSRVFMQIGKYVVEGLVIGMDRSLALASKSAKALGEEIPDAFDSGFGSGIVIDDLIDTDLNPVITPVIDPTEFDSGFDKLAAAFNGGFTSLDIGSVNYNGELVDRLDDFANSSKQLNATLEENVLDYDKLGTAVVDALVASGVHVEMDGNQLMGYLAGSVRDARRMR